MLILPTVRGYAERMARIFRWPYLRGGGGALASRVVHKKFTRGQGVQIAQIQGEVLTRLSIQRAQFLPSAASRGASQ